MKTAIPGQLVFRSIIALLIGGFTTQGLIAGSPSVVPIGGKVGQTESLRDLKGNRRPLQDFKAASGFVLAIAGIDCEVSKAYLPRLKEIEEKYGADGFQFLLVYPNDRDTLNLVAAHVYDHDVPFPVMKDFGQQLADRLAVKQTATVCLLDNQFVLRYRGRIDDQFSTEAKHSEATEHDLVSALDALLAGKDVAQAEVSVAGNPIHRYEPTAVKNELTYNKDVAPIIQRRCQSCHRPGRTAPFALVDYQDAVDWAETIKEVVLDRRMPPWHADARYGHFKNNRSMTDDEIKTVVAWINGAMPEGDPEDRRETVEWADGWAIGQPDAVFTMAKEFEVPADGVMPYRYFTVPTNFEEDRWVTMAEAVPGAPSVVHHIIIYMLSPGGIDPINSKDEMASLVTWTPGDSPVVCPPGTAIRIPKGTELVFEMHYTPTGTPAKDQSRVGVVFADGPPEREIHTNLFANGRIRIPAGAPHHREETTFTFHKDAQLLSLLPHMHWRGKAYRYEAIFPDGTTQVLLSVPRWDFNWQTTYWFADPIPMPKGTKIHTVAHWDNSENNLFNPDPSANVRWGLQTWEEMMVGMMQYVYEEPVTVSTEEVKPNPAAEAMFRLFDRNKDRVISGTEIPARFRREMDEFGIDPDVGITPVAFEVIFNELSKELRRHAKSRRK